MSDILKASILDGYSYGNVIVNYNDTYYRLLFYIMNNEIYGDYKHNVDLSKLENIDNQFQEGGSPVKNWDKDFVKNLENKIINKEFTLHKNEDYEEILNVLKIEGSIAIGTSKITTNSGRTILLDWFIVKPYIEDDTKLKFIIKNIKENNYL